MQFNRQELYFFFRLSIHLTQMRFYVRRADRQGNRITVGVLAGESTTGSIRSSIVQEKQ